MGKRRIVNSELRIWNWGMPTGRSSAVRWRKVLRRKKGNRGGREPNGSGATGLSTYRPASFKPTAPLQRGFTKL